MNDTKQRFIIKYVYKPTNEKKMYVGEIYESAINTLSGMFKLNEFYKVLSYNFDY
tara:strand:+ start:964 stop:1128 length:165 start_codon:yes stop_codon:yes gene_type:complete